MALSTSLGVTTGDTGASHTTTGPDTGSRSSAREPPAAVLTATCRDPRGSVRVQPTPQAMADSTQRRSHTVARMRSNTDSNSIAEGGRTAGMVPSWPSRGFQVKLMAVLFG